MYCYMLSANKSYQAGYPKGNSTHNLELSELSNVYGRPPFTTCYMHVCVYTRALTHFSPRVECKSYLRTDLNIPDVCLPVGC